MKMKKTVLITLTEDEHNALKAVAWQKGLSVSSYIGLLAKTACVYHEINRKEETA